MVCFGVYSLQALDEAFQFVDYLDKSTLLLEWLQMSAVSSFAELMFITVIPVLWCGNREAAR